MPSRLREKAVVPVSLRPHASNSGVITAALTGQSDPADQTDWGTADPVENRDVSPDRSADYADLQRIALSRPVLTRKMGSTARRLR